MASDRLRGNRSQRIIILDTNAILMLFEFNIDLEAELTKIVGSYKIIIPKQVNDELIRFSNIGDGKKKIFSKAALKLIKRYQIVETKEKNADAAIIALAKNNDAIVVTNDKNLIKDLKTNSVKVLLLRSKKKLEFA